MRKYLIPLLLTLLIVGTAADCKSQPGQHRAPSGDGAPAGPAGPRRITITCNIYDNHGKSLQYSIIADAGAFIVNGTELTSMDQYPYHKVTRTPFADIADVGPGVQVRITVTCSVGGLPEGWRIECQTLVNGVKDAGEHDVYTAKETNTSVVTVACEHLD